MPLLVFRRLRSHDSCWAGVGIHMVSLAVLLAALGFGVEGGLGDCGSALLGWQCFLAYERP